MDRQGDSSIMPKTLIFLWYNYSNASNSRADNSDCTSPVRSIIELVHDLYNGHYIVTKFGAD